MCNCHSSVDHRARSKSPPFARLFNAVPHSEISNIWSTNKALGWWWPTTEWSKCMGSSPRSTVPKEDSKSKTTVEIPRLWLWSNWRFFNITTGSDHKRSSQQIFWADANASIYATTWAYVHRSKTKSYDSIEFIPAQAIGFLMNVAASCIQFTNRWIDKSNCLSDRNSLKRKFDLLRRKT